MATRNEQGKAQDQAASGEEKSRGHSQVRHRERIAPMFNLLMAVFFCIKLGVEKEIQEKFDAFIKKKGLRKTAQRDAIVLAIFSSDEHFTSEQLFDRVRNHPAKPSRATVYRTISVLAEAELIREVDLGGEEKTYDPNFNNSPTHNHLVCIDCGKVLEFEDNHLEVLNDCLTRRLGFRPARQSLRIEACCEKLRSSGRCEDLIAARIDKKRLPRR